MTKADAIALGSAAGLVSSITAILVFFAAWAILQWLLVILIIVVAVGVSQQIAVCIWKLTHRNQK